MNHLSDIGIIKYEPWAFQNRVGCPHKTSRTIDINVRRLKWFVHKNVHKKIDFQKKLANFLKSILDMILTFLAMNTYYMGPLSPIFLTVSLSSFPSIFACFDHPMNFQNPRKITFYQKFTHVLTGKWKYKSSAF